MHSGSSRPPLSPAHSSTMKSLYARTQASASSWSVIQRKSWPANRTLFGKHSDRSMLAASMSARRSFT